MASTRQIAFACMLSIAASPFACGGGDSGADRALDAGGDRTGVADSGGFGGDSTALDAPPDATLDTSVDARLDAAHDTGGDATSEAGIDAGPGPFTLQITRSGGGSVNDVPNEISCGETCSATYAKGSLVKLTATSDSLSGFVGWAGACAGASVTCTVVMDADTILSATWNSCPGAHLASQRQGGTLDDRARGVAVDASGDVIVVGSFEGTASFGGASATSSGSRDVWIAKYTPAGALVWQGTYGGPGEDEALAVAVDGNGDVIVGGRFQQSASFGGAVFTSQGGFDAFVAKYSGVTGAPVWSRAFGGVYHDAATSLAVDGSGNAVVAGQYSYTATFDSTTLTSAGFYDVFVAKLDAASGAVGWAISGGGTGYDTAGGVTVDVNGDVVLVGTYYGAGSANFGAGVLPGSSVSQVVLAKYHGADGSTVYTRGWGGSGNAFGGGVATDAQDNVYIVGQAIADLTIAGSDVSSTSGGFVAELAPDATALTWSYPIPAAGWPDPLPLNGGATVALNGDRVPQIALDPNGDVVLTTGAPPTGTFGASRSMVADHRDFAVARLGPGGLLRWMQRFGGSGDDIGLGVAVDATGTTTVVGGFTGTTELCDGWTPSLGGEDAFLLRLARTTPGTGSPTSLLSPDAIPGPLVPPDAGSSCHPPGPPIDAGPAKGVPTFNEVAFSLPPFPDYVTAHVVGDFNGDGTQDLFLVSNGSSAVPLAQQATVLSNDGTGAMSDATSAVLGTTSLELDLAVRSVALDANGDGKTDLLLGQLGPDTWPTPGAQSRLLLQTSGGLVDGTFGSLPLMNAYGNGYTAADVDCNGSPDALVSTLLYNDAAGHFRPGSPREFPATLPWWRAAFCDITHDGAPDLITGWSATQLYYNDGFGHFILAPANRTPTSVARVQDVVCADFDRDGYADVAWLYQDSAGQGHIALWENAHDGSLVDVTASRLPSTNDGFEDEMVVADVNADGWPDIIASDNCTPPFGVAAQVLLNQGGGVFVENDTLIPSDIGCSRVFPIDANGDGKTDLVRVKLFSGLPSSILINTTP
jgi:hypothetical protein